MTLTVMAMRRFIILILLFIGLGELDFLALDGRYSKAAWEAAKYEGATFREQLDDFFTTTLKPR